MDFLFDIVDTKLDFIFTQTPWSSKSDSWKISTRKLFKIWIYQHVDNPVYNIADNLLFDYVRILRDIANSGADGRITVRTDDARFADNELISEGVSFYIPYKDLARILPEISFTLNFYTTSVNYENYNLIFDTLWRAGLRDKFFNTYNELLTMFFDEGGSIRQEIRDQYKGKNWRVVLYKETGMGVVRVPLKGKFSSNVIEFNPLDSLEIHMAIANLVAYTLLYSRCFGVVKCSSMTNFLYYDAFGVYSHEYIQSSTSSHKMGGSLFWTNDKSFYTLDEYSRFIAKFRDNDENKYFNDHDIRYLSKFKPLYDIDREIVSYILVFIRKSLQNHYGRDFFPDTGSDSDIIVDLR